MHLHYWYKMKQSSIAPTLVHVYEMTKKGRQQQRLSQDLGHFCNNIVWNNTQHSTNRVM